MRRFKVEKDFIVDGFRCVVVGTSMGHRCGYVEIPAEHKYYNKDYDELMHLDVHGGLTYSAFNDSNYPVVGSKKQYWIGFDCSHYMDGKDFELIKELADAKIYNHMIEMEKMFGFSKSEIVRTTEFVEQELIDLVKQLKEVV